MKILQGWEVKSLAGKEGQDAHKRQRYRFNLADVTNIVVR
jgi:hypothetical protein